MPILPVSRLVAENNFPKARKMLHHTYLEVLPQLLLTTMMMTTSIFLALTTKKRNPRRLPKSAKKAKKPALIAKTSVLLDCKPWDDETDMDAMLKAVKTIEMDGLVWGASKLVPVGYGIDKLSVMCVVEDLKVSIDELQEKICEFEDFVQSCDVAAMNKI